MNIRFDLDEKTKLPFVELRGQTSDENALLDQWLDRPGFHGKIVAKRVDNVRVTLSMEPLPVTLLEAPAEKALDSMSADELLDKAARDGVEIPANVRKNRPGILNLMRAAKKD